MKKLFKPHWPDARRATRRGESVFSRTAPAIAADDEARPEWQLAIAASPADPTNDRESAIRNLEPNDVER